MVIFVPDLSAQSCVMIIGATSKQHLTMSGQKRFPIKASAYHLVLSLKQVS